jgi:hypothetical protein
MLGWHKKPAQLNEQPEKIRFDQDTTTLQKDFFYRLVRLANCTQKYGEIWILQNRYPS